ALGDPTRLAIVERLLARGELSVGDLAEPFEISMPAISRHLQVLEQAGLIERRVEKQWRYIRARRQGLVAVESWVARQRAHWTAVSVTFTAAPGGTRLVLLQKEFESVNARDLHGQGWSSALNCLEQAA